MDTRRVTFHAMAALNEVVLAADDAAAADALARRAIAEVARIEAAYSRYRGDSIVSRINAAAGGAAVECDDETLALLAHAEQLHRASGGLFDITSGVLRRAWNFRQPRVPSRSEIEALLPLVGWPEVERDGRRVRLPRAGMELDFGGFGKEYAADRAAALLADAGVRHGYVNLAGDIRVVGPRPDGTPWRIGIRHPRRAGSVLATIPLAHGALATSGDYERSFVHDGVRYCHVLNPRTGWPVRHWQSVSVLAPLAVLAGSLSTIAMLAEAQAPALLEAHAADYLAVDSEGRIHRKRDAAPGAAAA